MYYHAENYLKRFLKQIFCPVGRNSPYVVNDFVNVLLDAVEHTDFTNNTCIRVNGPTGETVFSRLNGTDFDKIEGSFFEILKRIFPSLRRLLRNRRVGLAFDITDEPFYGKVDGLWIHAEKPVRGCTGCFKFLTVTAVDRNNKLILGSLPVRRGYDIVQLVTRLITAARAFIRPELCLFDRGFDNLRLLDNLQRMGVRYQLLWKKDGWTSKEFKKMERGQIKEVNRVRPYQHDKSGFKVKVRFVLIKKYRRYKKGKSYNWVFATNTRKKWQHQYVDAYKKRWGIETAFRVLDNIQIKTTTKNEIIRYFINIFCCLVYNLWKCANILESPTTLKNFVVNVLKSIRVKATQEIAEG